MTTIAYRDGIMAADSRAYAGFNANLGTKRKIRRCADGRLIGCSTNQVGLGEAILDWYEAGADAASCPKSAELKFVLLVVSPDGTAFYANDDFNLAGPIEADFFAIGSGEGEAHGAMHAGASAAEAVEIACRCDVWSGLPVVTIRHAEG
jgi:ATP-dependent protease HslVU (ClpYQ) peptidase subunit